jgi:hypothetical protein
VQLPSKLVLQSMIKPHLLTTHRNFTKTTGEYYPQALP